MFYGGRRSSVSAIINLHMKIVLMVWFILMPLLAIAQKKPVQIVFDVTSSDSSTHDAVLRHVKGLASAYPEAKLEVVVYGAAWPMLVNGKSRAATSVAELARLDNVDFKLCGITMERHGVKPTDLVTGVEVVPDAIMEIVTRQGEGWGYIKESHH